MKIKKHIPSYVWPLGVLLIIIVFEKIKCFVLGLPLIPDNIDSARLLSWIISHLPIPTFIILLSTIIFLILFVKEIGVTSIGKDGISFKNKQEFQVSLATDLLMIINYHAEMKESASYIDHIGTLEDQMEVAEKAIMEITSILKKRFITMIKPRLEPEVSIGDTREYNVFIRCSRNAEEALRRLFQSSFKENHLDQYTEENFIEYISKKQSRYTFLLENIFEDLKLYSTFEEDKDVQSLIKNSSEISVIFQKTFFSARRFGLDRIEHKKIERAKFHKILLDFFEKYGLEVEKNALVENLFSEETIPPVSFGKVTSQS